MINISGEPPKDNYAASEYDCDSNNQQKDRSLHVTWNVGHLLVSYVIIETFLFNNYFK